MTIPAHLTGLIGLNGCIGCTDSNGNCLTVSWQSAFQKALGNVVEQRLSNPNGAMFCTVIPNNNETERRSETQSSSSMVGHRQISTNFSSSLPKPTADNGMDNCTGTKTTRDQPGISCSECGKVSIALYPSSKGRQRLVCKQCKRRKL